ncbi:35826_t:CDS:2, partial [Gigaspora margarita]
MASSTENGTLELNLQRQEPQQTNDDSSKESIQVELMASEKKSSSTENSTLWLNSQRQKPQQTNDDSSKESAQVELIVSGKKVKLSMTILKEAHKIELIVASRKEVIELIVAFRKEVIEMIQKRQQFAPKDLIFFAGEEKANVNELDIARNELADKFAILQWDKALNFIQLMDQKGS